MLCPECGSRCWREEVDVGVGFYCTEWGCSSCGWDEGLGEPMNEDAWDRFINDGWELT